MPGPQTAGQLQQVPFKENLIIVVSDPDIPPGPAKDSKRLDAGDLRPKVVNWDVSILSPVLPATAVTGDFLKVTVGGTYSGVLYTVGDGAFVLNKGTNALLPMLKYPPTGGGGDAVSGAVWLKSVTKGPGFVPSSALTVSNQGNYSIRELTGDEPSLSLVIGALPGVTSETDVVVYCVPGCPA